ncbi:MAG: hypothetical protein U0452_04280 [Anaerolineae bacterium]
MFFSRRKPKDQDPPPVGGRDRQFRGIFAGVPLIIGLVTVALFVLLVILNARFVQNVATCRLYYPDSTVLTEDQPYFLQPFGQLTSLLHSPDAPDVVTTWYNQHYAATVRAAMAEDTLTAITPITWQVTPADDGGSEIFLVCP